MSPADSDGTVTIARGSIRLARELCERCFAGSEAVALLAHEGRVLVVPLAPDSAGGLLLKLRNARGDRVIQAQEFLRQQGVIEEFGEREVPVRWCPEMAALELEGLRSGTSLPQQADRDER